MKFAIFILLVLQVASSEMAVEMANAQGPAFLRDPHFIDEMTNFVNERIPERVVHAKGGGAFGYFEVTHDISAHCAAHVFDTVGRRTRVAVRFSTIAGESGAADTERDPRGFAVRFYTEDGAWDLVGNNTPIFFVRDPTVFPEFVHTQKRHAATHRRDADAFWRFLAEHPQTTHQTLFLFGDRGLPDGFRHMHGYGSHAFKMVNASGAAAYCKFHYKTEQGVRWLSAERARALAGANPDYSLQDLYESIARGEYPAWTLYVQIMTYEQASALPFNPFDVTKVWPHADFPLRPVGRFVLDENPTDYFEQIEKLAFSPGHLVRGIEPSPDTLLRGRLFAYPIAHGHRLGADPDRRPPNCPFRAPNERGECPAGPKQAQGSAPIVGPRDVVRADTGDEDNFSQARAFWRRVLDDEAKERLVGNVVGHMKNANETIQRLAVANFAQVDADLASRIGAGLAAERLGKVTV